LGVLFFMLRWLDENPQGSGRQLTRTSEYVVRVLRSERGPWSVNEHGNIQSLTIRHKNQTPLWVFYFYVAIF